MNKEESDRRGRLVDLLFSKDPNGPSKGEIREAVDIGSTAAEECVKSLLQKCTISAHPPLAAALAVKELMVNLPTVLDGIADMERERYERQQREPTVSGFAQHLVDAGLARVVHSEDGISLLELKL